jgi:hypothetical protein
MDSIFPFPSGTDFVGKADRESRLGRLDNPNGGTDCSPCSATRRCRSGLRDEAEGKQRDHENRTESRAEPEVRIQFPPAESRVRTRLCASRSCARRGTRFGLPRQKTQAIVKQACNAIGIFSSDAANPDTARKFYADIQMLTTGVGAPPDPEGLMRQFLSSEIAAKENKWQRGNATRWHNEAYDNLFHSAEGELDPVKRAALFIAMNDMVVEPAWSFLLYVARRCRQFLESSGRH